MRDLRNVVSLRTKKSSARLPRVVCASLALFFVSSLSVVAAEDTSLKDGAKRAGHTIGTVARDVGQGAKKVGKAVGDAAKEGGREFRRAIKGESR